MEGNRMKRILFLVVVGCASLCQARSCKTNKDCDSDQRCVSSEWHLAKKDGKKGEDLKHFKNFTVEKTRVCIPKAKKWLGESCSGFNECALDTHCTKRNGENGFKCRRDIVGGCRHQTHCMGSLSCKPRFVMPGDHWFGLCGIN